MRRDAADTPVKSRGQTTSNKLRTSCPMSRWGTAAHLGVNRTITALGIVARHAGSGLEPFVVRELLACRRTRDVSSCRGGPNGAADSQTAAKLAQGRVRPHARATQRSVGAGGARDTREGLGQPFAFLARAASSFRKNWQGVDARGIEA